MKRTAISRAMGTTYISKLASALVLIWTGLGTAEAQWNYEVDVKSQISANALDCTSCDLSGNDLHGTRLKNSRFSGAILNRVNLSGGVIYKSDFSGAHLRKAFLARVQASEVVFRGANLNGSTMTEIQIKNSDFQGATLSGAEISKGAIIDTNLRGANLSRIIALASSFEGSDLSLAYLDGANLTGSNFKNTVLVNTKFGTANINAVQFDGARMEGARLADVQGLTQGQLDLACGDGKTELPVDLTIKYCAETMVANEVHENGMHAGLAERDREIALRSERAIRHAETLLEQATSENRRLLELIHADLLAIQRKIEN